MSQYLYPSNEERLWYIKPEFLSEREPLLLLVQVSTQDALANLKGIGYAVYELAPNSEVRHGTWTMDLQELPISLQPN